MMAQPQTTTAVSSFNRNTLARSASLVALMVLLVSLCLLSIAVGTRDVPWPEIVSALQGQVNSIGEAAVAMRIPRTVLAVVAGAALGLAGAIMQGVTRNPLPMSGRPSWEPASPRSLSTPSAHWAGAGPRPSNWPWPELPLRWPYQALPSP